MGLRRLHVGTRNVPVYHDLELPGFEIVRRHAFASRRFSYDHLATDLVSIWVAVRHLHFSAKTQSHLSFHHDNCRKIAIALKTLPSRPSPYEARPCFFSNCQAGSKSRTKQRIARSYQRVRAKLPEGSLYISVLLLICMIASFA